MSVPTNQKRRCYNCKFYYRHDDGYSNYTVMETKVDCLHGKNPNLPTDEGYDWETDDHAFMRVAEACDGFSEGKPLTVDCDEEDAPYPLPEGRSLASYYTKDEEVIAAFIAHTAEPAPMSDNFADAPQSIAEIRSTKAHNGRLWTPRDALIAVLRDIDAGKIKVRNIAIGLTVEAEDGDVVTEHVAAYQSRLELLGTVLKTMNWVSGQEP